MIYFSGFCLKNEEILFDDFLDRGEFTAAGFSKGAQDALSYVLNSGKRIDRLQLFSPAFFLYNEKAAEINIKAFKKNKRLYIEKFFKKAGFFDEKFFNECSEEDLQKLFLFDWRIIENIKNIKIEVFLGEYDRIIALKKAGEFFVNYADVYFIKKANHFLRS